jgi:hypothetical protein
VDHAFRHTVLEQVLREKHRAVAIPRGVNVAAVVQHAIRAKRRASIRAVLLSLLSLAALIYCVFGTTQLFTVASSVASATTQEQESTAIVSVLPSLLLFLVPSWSIAAIHCVFGTTQLFAVASSLASATTQEQESTAIISVLPSLLPFLVLFWSIAALILFVDSIARNRTLRILRKGCPIVADTGRLTQFPGALCGDNLRNVVVYRGFSPFVESGIDLGGWSFVVRLDKAKKEFGVPTEPVPFTNSALYCHIRSRINALALDELLIQDKLYVNGRDIRDDRRFLRDPMGPPVATVPSDVLEHFVNNSSETVRHYMATHLIQWKGELVISCFLRVTQPGRNLFVEASYFLLPPVKESYYIVDSLPPRFSGRELLGLAARSALAAPFLSLAAPFILTGELLAPYRHWRERRKAEQLIKDNYSFDYGATASIRVLAASSNYRRYFQKLDKEMGLKLVERAILDSIVEFLDAKKIDTSDLRERTSMIFNNGVIVSGGYIRTETFTGGQGATSEVVKQFTRAAHDVAPGPHRETGNGY